MADFVQTMRDWKRMCEKMEYQYIDKACEHCPVYNDKSTPCDAIFFMAKDTDWGRTAALVEEWAEEHPEPQYPTWLEWLHKQLPELHGQDDHGAILTLLSNRIPADIAQKLGIEPKEDA